MQTTAADHLMAVQVQVSLHPGQAKLVRGKETDEQKEDKDYKKKQQYTAACSTPE